MKQVIDKVDSQAIYELNEIAREGVQVLEPGELGQLLNEMAENSNMSLYQFVSRYVDAFALITVDDERHTIKVDDTVPAVVSGPDAVYVEVLGNHPSKEWLRDRFTDTVKARQLIDNVPLYTVKIGSVSVGDDWHWLDGERLWQAISEFSAESVYPDPVPLSVTKDQLEDWQNLPDDNIEVLLKSALEEGFIPDYQIEDSQVDKKE